MKKYLIMILCALMIFSFTGCSSKNVETIFKEEGYEIQYIEIRDGSIDRGIIFRKDEISLSVFYFEDKEVFFYINKV